MLGEPGAIRPGGDESLCRAAIHRAHHRSQRREGAGANAYRRPVRRLSGRIHPCAGCHARRMYGIALQVTPMSIPSATAVGSFRVEEYKKPEFEVTVDAPKDPVMLGDTVTATVKANYYFGAPVTNAKVHYKVLRTATAPPGIPRTAGTGSMAAATGGSPPITPGIPAGARGAARAPSSSWWGYHAQPQPEWCWMTRRASARTAR